MVSYFVETGSYLEPWLAYKSLDQASLQLSEVCLSLPHEYWDIRCVPPHWAPQFLPMAR